MSRGEFDAVLTIGDPCGVGPELALEALGSLDFGRVAVMGGPEWVGPLLEGVRRHSEERFRRLSELVERSASRVTWVSLGVEAEVGSPGGWHEGNVAFIDAALSQGIELALEHGCGLVTGPVDKRFFGAIGMRDSGHTEYLVRRFETPATMFFDSRELRLALITRHIPLAEVSARVEKWLLVQTAEHVDGYLKRIGADLGGAAGGGLAIVGVDPHCGEWGLISDLDRGVRGWVEELREEGIQIFGPISADTAFLPEMRSRYGALLCWYHDQGMIPVKLLGFGDAVNVTLGLPLFRTSPAHGVAYGLAWRGEASGASFARALAMALSGRV